MVSPSVRQGIAFEQLWHQDGKQHPWVMWSQIVNLSSQPPVNLSLEYLGTYLCVVCCFVCCFVFQLK